MIPEQSIAVNDLEVVNYPSLTYSIDFENKRICGKIDGLDAIVQAAKKRLSTERFSTPIYSSDYGAELEWLVGKDYELVAAYLEGEITETLLVDDRILGISDFSIERSELNGTTVSLTINSTEGDIQLISEVQIA